VAAEPSRGRATEVEPGSAPEADAARALYERHAGQLYGFCLHRLGSREEAEDAVQTTFLNAFRGLRRGVVPEAEAAWLFKIAENVCLTRRRSAWRRGRVESPSDMQVLQDVTPARQTDGGDELIPLSDALAAMPDSQRRAILLREWQGLSYKEISDEMDVSQSAVETLIFRARRSLANALETPWESRRAAGQAGQRAFNLGSLLAGLKGLFAGGAAAKVAVVAVAATGTAALAVAEAQHESPLRPRVEPSAASARAPDSAARRPVVVASADSVGDLSAERRGGASSSQAESGQARSGKKPATRSPRALEPAGTADEAGKTKARSESETGDTPPGRAKESGTPATSRGRAVGHEQAKDPSPKAKPRQKPKPKPKSPAPKPKPAAEPKPAPTPAPTPESPTPTQPSGGFAPAPAAPPPPPPPPPPSPPSEKEKDKPKGG
jgi:RNA polymerase sigma factor (sigma-70 family)